MTTLQQILRKYLRAGTPGGAGGVGVPADEKLSMAAELAPVLAALRRTEAQAAEIRQAARERAETATRQAADRAARLVEDANTHAETVRTEAARARLARARADLEALGAAADGEIERIQAGVAERLPGHVDRVVGIARDILAGQSRPAEQPSSGEGTL